MEGDLKSSSSFTIGNTAQETGLSYLPDCYVFPPSHRPSLAPEVANVPIIDFAMLKQNPSQRAQVIRAIGNACRRFGYFQVSMYLPVSGSLRTIWQKTKGSPPPYDNSLISI